MRGLRKSVCSELGYGICHSIGNSVELRQNNPNCPDGCLNLSQLSCILNLCYLILFKNILRQWCNFKLAWNPIKRYVIRSNHKSDSINPQLSLSVFFLFIKSLVTVPFLKSTFNLQCRLEIIIHALEL